MSDFFDEQVEEDGDFDDYIVSLINFSNMNRLITAFNALRT